jgi:regulation of enolase protein 1 (concanavalin A-like superfamily)
VAAGRQVLNTTPSVRPLAASPLRFSPSGDRLVLSGWTEGQAVEIWDAAPLDPPAPAAEGPRTIAGWGEIVDPGRDCTFTEADGRLTIAVPGTVHDLNLDFYKNAKGLSAPRVLQAVDGDFTLQVKVSGDFDPGPVPAEPGKTSFHGAGLIVWLDARSYVRVERGAWIRPDGDANVGLPTVEYWKNGRPNAAASWSAEGFRAEGRSAYLRLERRKGEIRAAISNDGRQWAYRSTPLNVDLPSAVRVGVDAVNTSKEPFTAEFEELKLTRDAPEAPDEPPPGGKQ